MTEGRCVVIELPIRDVMEELILPFELAVERLMFDLEFAVEELLPKRLPMLMLLFDLLADDEELEGSLPMLTLPDGREVVLRFVIILLELFLDVMALELRLGIVTDGRLVVGARLVMLLEEVLRLGKEMVGLRAGTTVRMLLLTLLLELDGRETLGAGADLAAGALLEELLDFAFFFAEKAGSVRKISAQASIISAIAGFFRFFRANMICLLSSIKPRKRPRSFTTLHKKGTNSLKSNEKIIKPEFFHPARNSFKCCMFNENK